MKRDFLKTLGIEDSLIDKIMDENGRDINLAKSTLQADVDRLNKEIEAHKSQAADWQSKYETTVNAHKDYDVLKQFHDDAMAKQTKERQSNWLKGQGCKHPELFVGQIDFSKATYDEEKNTYTGLDEVIKGFRNNYADMFEKNGTQNVNPTPQPNAGQDSSFMERYQKEHPESARFIK